MPATWISSYLRRVGYEGSLEPALETLQSLHERHLYSVPFENLDIHWKRPIVADTGRFITKIVDERRGGFCYELNGAFGALLREVGFDVTMLSGRVTTASGGFGPPFDHMALMVRLPDGSRWLADVGFGDSFVRPLSLDERGEQRDPAGTFRIVPGDEEWQMQMLRDGEWMTEYLFTLDPHALEDYAPMCHWQQTSPESSFTKKRICSLATEWGRITLTADQLIVTRDGVRQETPVSAEEWANVLRDTFGVVQASRPASGP
jgi:N-hydroxyarylamine O-acetyltransferase